MLKIQIGIAGLSKLKKKLGKKENCYSKLKRSEMFIKIFSGKRKIGISSKD